MVLFHATFNELPKQLPMTVVLNEEGNDPFGILAA